MQDFMKRANEWFASKNEVVKLAIAFGTFIVFSLALTALTDFVFWALGI